MNSWETFMKPKIFTLLGNNTTLNTTGGDKINEIRFYTALSKHFEVYYNGQLFDPYAIDYGIKDLPIQIPEDNYDVYYVRANNRILYNCPRPKVAMGIPYSSWLYHHVDAVITTTESWKQAILNYNNSTYYRELVGDWYGNSEKIIVPKKVINIRQTIDSNFMEKIDANTLMRNRISFGLKPTFGFFGSLAMQIFPNLAIKALQRMINNGYDINIIAAGKKYSNTIVPNKVKYLGYLPYESIPDYIQTCTCLIANEGVETEYLGSGKVLDAIAAGIPILSYRSAVREEQLGKDYLGFYSSEEEAYFIAKFILENPFFRKKIVDQLKLRYEMFSTESQGDYLYKQFSDLII